MALNWNILTCAWVPGGDEPPVLGPSPHDYVLTKQPAASMMQTGNYPQEVYVSIPKDVRETGNLMLIYAVGYQDEEPLPSSEEFGYELDGQHFWCTPITAEHGQKFASRSLPWVIGLGLGITAGYVASQMMRKDPVWSSAIGGLGGLVLGMAYTGFKHGTELPEGSA